LPKVKNLNLFYKNNLAVIISSPSGAGKTTVTKKLISLFKGSYLSVSCTTRDKRPSEINGKDYFFISKNKFEKYKNKKKFIEYAKVHNNYYGTLKSEVIKNLKKKIVFFDVDWQGARVLKKKLKENCFSIFLLPPSINILKKRLFKRHKDNYKMALSRYKFAKRDILHFKEYDYLVVNDDLPACISVIKNKIKEIIRDKQIYLKSYLTAKKMLTSKQV
jgi:guanylate kinase